MGYRHGGAYYDTEFVSFVPMDQTPARDDPELWSAVNRPSAADKGCVVLSTGDKDDEPFYVPWLRVIPKRVLRWLIPAISLLRKQSYVMIVPCFSSLLIRFLYDLWIIVFVFLLDLSFSLIPVAYSLSSPNIMTAHGLALLLVMILKCRHEANDAHYGAPTHAFEKTWA